MGSGASIDIDVNNDELHDQYIRKLLSSKEERELLFTAISEYKCDDSSSLKGRVGLLNLVNYFKDPSNVLYPGFKVNVDVLSESLKFVMKERKKRSNRRNHKKARKTSNTSTLTSVEEHMDIVEFHAFFPVLLLFTKLWTIFDEIDREMINDRRVFKGEFMRVRTHLNDFDFKILGDTTEEQWEAEFRLINLNNDQYIDFHELCLFGLKHIHNAFNYTDIYADTDNNINEADENNAEDCDDEEETGDSIIEGDSLSGSTTLNGIMNTEYPEGAPPRDGTVGSRSKNNDVIYV